MQKVCVVSLTTVLLQLLRKLTPSKEERDTLTEVASMLTPLKNKLKLAVQNAGPAAKRKPG